MEPKKEEELEPSIEETPEEIKPEEAEDITGGLRF